jgi:hypothetical protein
MEPEPSIATLKYISREDLAALLLADTPDLAIIDVRDSG